MTARSIDIANAVTTHLNAQPFTVVFQAQRVNWAFFRQEEQRNPIGFVSPEGLGPYVQNTRKEFSATYEIKIVVVQPLYQGTLKEQDDMIDLMEQIIRSMLNVKMDGSPQLSVEDDAAIARFEETAFETGNYFASAVSFFYLDMIEV